MATRINFDDIPKNELEYRRMLHILKLPPLMIESLMNMYRKSLKVDDPYNGETVIDSKVSGARVIRKSKSLKNIELPFYDATPYGIEEYKILLPKEYSFIKKKNTQVIDIETIYNICMCMKNIHFWLLLTYDQKLNVYNTLKENPNTPLYGYRERGFTFTNLLNDITKYILPFDTLFVKLVRALKTPEYDESQELLRMYEQNISKICTLHLFLTHLNSILEYDPILASSLLYYKPLIWFFVSNNVIIKDIDVNEYYINGTPPIKNISFKEYPI